MAHPDTIGPYRVLEAIASGGMAEVFEVEDPSSGERLALKLLMRLKVALKRFNREYEAMARLNHPGVVRVYHYGLHNTQPWLTMELLQGRNAHLWVTDFGPPGTKEREAEVLRLGYHLSTALHYVHDRGLVHRDLKSANVLVLPDARVKLVDFGTAHLVDATERITREGEFVGTFAYASPEQLQGDRQVTQRSDLYSLGVLLYRLTTGRRPFAAKEPAELAWQHIHEPPPDARQFVPDLPEGLIGLMSHLLEKDPANRPQSAGEVATELERLAGSPYSTRSAVVLHRTRSTHRQVESNALWRHIEGSAPGTPLVVIGDAGADTDRFLVDLCQRAPDHGCIAAQTAFRRGRDLTALTRLFLALARGMEGVPEVVQAVATIQSHSVIERRSRADSRAAVLVSAAQIIALRSEASGSRVLIVVRDASFASALGAEDLLGLVTELQRRGAKASVILSAIPEDQDLHRPLGLLIRQAHVVTLEPMDLAGVAMATGTMLGRRAPPAHLARRLHGVSGGQPRYLEQVVQGLVASKELLAEDNQLLWSAQALELAPPAEAVADARRLLAGIPVRHHHILQAVAVAEGADVSLLASLMGWSDEELMPVLDALVLGGLIRWDSAGLPIWGHPAIAREVVDRLQPWRRSTLADRLARMVREQGEPSAVMVRALINVGAPLEAARAAAVVCRAQFARHEVRSALTLLDRVVRDLAGREVPNHAVYAETFLLHSLCLQAVNPSHPDTARAIGVARRMAQRPPEMVARVQWGQATLAMAIGHYRNYQKLVDDALETLTDCPGTENTQAWLKIEQGNARRLAGSVVRADASYAKAEAIGRQTGDLQIVARATVGIACCQHDMGNIAAAEEQSSRAMSQLERMRDHHGFWQALSIWGQAMRRQGRYSDALSVLYRRAPEARNHEDPRSYSALLLTMAWCELDLQRLGRAQEYVDELGASTGKGEHLHVRIEASLVHGRILLSSGQRRQAAYLLQGVEQKARLAELRVLAEQARAWHAEALWALGDRDTARSMYQSAVLGLMGLGVRPALADACISRAQSLARERSAEELFQPLQSWLESSAPPLVRLEELLARGESARRAGDRRMSRVAYREAAMVLNRVATTLNDTDRAALRVHGWSRRIRRGLQ